MGVLSSRHCENIAEDDAVIGEPFLFVAVVIKLAAAL
jgi:hypothetical protein